MEPKLIAIAGPTASGKTGIAVRLARRINGEIISADSRQVYRRMDIGTGKDLDEYQDIPYHLIDIAEPGTKYNLHRYLDDFHTALQIIESHGKTPIICGGTGLYLESALSGLRMPEVPENPELRVSLQGKDLKELEQILATYRQLHNTTDSDTKQRAIRAIEIEEYYRTHPEEATAADKNKTTPLNCKIFAVDIPRELRRQRITERLDNRLANGMVEEIRKLLTEGINPDSLIYYGLEYKYVTYYIQGKMTFQEFHDKLEIEIHRFAKRQMTWLRGMERRGFKLTWIPWDIEIDKLLSLI